MLAEARSDEGASNNERGVYLVRYEQIFTNAARPGIGTGRDL